MDKHKDVLSGMVGSVCCVYSGMPFDVVKTRLQIKNNYKGVFDCLQQTIKNESIKALWKGSLPALSSALLENSVLFTANSIFKDLFIYYRKNPEYKIKPIELYMCAGLSGVFSSTAITPMEVIKVRMINQRKKIIYKNPLDCGIKIVKKEGILGLYNGYSTNLLRDVPFSAIFLGTYDTLCHLVVKYNKDYKSKKDIPTYLIPLLGGISGGIGWSIVFPFDVIKSRFQSTERTSSSTIFKTFQSIIKNEGFRYLYKGVNAAVLRAIPANSFLILGVEISKRFLDNI
eukprot:TRINITY_DN1379_c0_g2_i1.p1 TRINITY_DN1379_c0_g2~~TRINITY_DN1379_c0_g2_i1.p1  ORF type:complete len:286 (-),score=44.63 TRINITY_DN1379_c0_g2_i1:306-1163(-)